MPGMGLTALALIPSSIDGNKNSAENEFFLNSQNFKTELSEFNGSDKLLLHETAIDISYSCWKCFVSRVVLICQCVPLISFTTCPKHVS